jgi:hypothetical protein
MSDLITTGPGTFNRADIKFSIPYMVSSNQASCGMLHGNYKLSSTTGSITALTNPTMNAGADPIVINPSDTDKETIK